MNVFLIWEDICKCDGPCTVTKWGGKWIVDKPIMGFFGGLLVAVAVGGLQLVCEFVTFNFSVIKLCWSNSQASCKSVYMSDEIICVPVVHGADDALSGSAVRAFRAGALPAGTHEFMTESIDTAQLWRLYRTARSCSVWRPKSFWKWNYMLSCIYELPEETKSKDSLIAVERIKIETQEELVSCLWACCHNFHHCCSDFDRWRRMWSYYFMYPKPEHCKIIFQWVQKTCRLISVRQGLPQCCFGREGILFLCLEACVICLSGVDAPLLCGEGLQEMSAPKSPYVVGAVVHVHNINTEPALRVIFVLYI